MAKPKQSLKKPTAPKRSWRDIPDATHRTFNSWPSPESLHPDADTVFNAACGNPEARAIVDSYQCRLPVVMLDRAVLEVL